MSLPDAKKVTSENPPKTSVASPVVAQEQERDVDRKLRLYGVIQAFRNGRMPDNAQIDETLLFVRDHSPINTADLSTDGRRLIDDTRNLIETARRFVKEKNADEVVQQFIYHTSSADSANVPEVEAPVSEKIARKDARQALEHLRTLFQLLVTNAESRKLLKDFRLIGSGILADAATNVADRARPDAAEMERVDEATPTHHFDAAPTTNGVPASGPEVTVADKTGVATSSAAAGQLEQPSVDGASTSVKKEDTSTTKKEDTATVKKEDTTTAKKTLRSRFFALSNRVPDDQKQRVNTEFESGKQYLRDNFPKERRDQFVYRLKKVVVECQSQPSYQNALSWFLSQIAVYFGHGKRLASSGADQTTTFFSDPKLIQAGSEMRSFLERCANGQSMDGMIDAGHKLWEDAQNDEELRAWWGRVDVFARKALLEPGFILSPMFDSQFRELRDESQQFFDVKYHESRDALVDAVQSWFTSWTDDPLNKRLANDWNSLVKDLLFDDGGDLTFKPQLWKDIRHVIVPTLVEKVGCIPIPRIEYMDKDFDLVLENLTLQGRNLFPNILEIDARNHIKVSPYQNIRDEHHHTVTLTLAQIQADMRDVAFFYRKKTGLRITDSGLADVFLGGKGITITVTVTSSTADRKNGDSLFKVKNVSVKVDALKFAIRDSHHNLLYKTLRPLATGLIKRQIKKAIAEGIRTGLEYADAELVDVRNRMETADATEGESKTQVLKDKFSGKTGDTSTKAESVKEKRSSQFRIVPKRDSMLLPDQAYEKGWSRKQFEREDAAKEGSGWHSKAFSVVPTAA